MSVIPTPITLFEQRLRLFGGTANRKKKFDATSDSGFDSSIRALSLPRARKLRQSKELSRTRRPFGSAKVDLNIPSTWQRTSSAWVVTVVTVGTISPMEACRHMQLLQKSSTHAFIVSARQHPCFARAAPAPDPNEYAHLDLNLSCMIHADLTREKTASFCRRSAAGDS